MRWGSVGGLPYGLTFHFFAPVSPSPPSSIQNISTLSPTLLFPSFFCLKGREQNTFGRVFVRPYSMVIFEIGLLFRARGGCCDIAPLPKAKSTPPGHIRGPLR